MTHQRLWEPDHSIDDLIPDFPPDSDALLAYEPPPNADDAQLAAMYRADDTQPVVVTARDLWPDMHPRDYLLTPPHRRSPSGNVIRLEAEEAWAPGVEDGDE